MKLLNIILPSILAITLLTSCGGNGDGTPTAERTNILGAGATFPAPLITAMADQRSYKQEPSIINPLVPAGVFGNLWNRP